MMTDHIGPILTYPNSRYGDSVLGVVPCHIYHRRVGVDEEHDADNPRCWCSPMVLPVEVFEEFTDDDLHQLLSVTSQ